MKVKKMNIQTTTAKWFLVCAVLIGAHKVRASESPENKIFVSPMSSQYNINGLKGLGSTYQLQKANSVNLDQKIESRDQLLASVGLIEEVKGWDHFEKDVLVLSASNMEFSRLKNKYSKISASKLLSLRKSLGK